MLQCFNVTTLLTLSMFLTFKYCNAVFGFCRLYSAKIMFFVELHKKRPAQMSWPFLVPGTGIEPALPCGNMVLNHARLPIPPPGRWICKEPNGFIKHFRLSRRKLCPGQESNLHSLAGTWPSTMRVYQFRHPGFSKKQCKSNTIF